jgi:hypothetical protein
VVPLVMLALALTACDTFMPARQPAAPPPAPPTDAPGTESTAMPPPRPVPRPARKPAVGQPAAAPGQTQPPPVIGMNREALRQHFGEPTQERAAPPARVLEFGQGDCRLAVYLYLDTARNDFYALQYEVNGAAPTGPDADLCLARIARDAERR